MRQDTDRPTMRPPPPADLAGMRVLVVEDHAIGRVLMEAMLAGLGIAATLVASGEEARAAVRAADYDVVLIDLGLPDVAGDDLARTLSRRLGAADRAPVFIAVTGRARPPTLPAVFTDWLEKPFSLRELHGLLAGLDRAAMRSA